MTDAEKSCPMCGKSNPADAQRCLHCGASLTSPQSSGAATSSGPLSQGPGCVVAYALMLGFGGIGSAFIGLLFLSEALRSRLSLTTALTLGYFSISGIALLSIAWGLFKYRNWARVGVVLVLPLGMFATFLFAVTGGSLLGALIQLGIGGYILHWFATHPQYFEVVEPEEFIRDIRWPVGINVGGYLIFVLVVAINNFGGQYLLSARAAATARIVNPMATRQAAAVVAVAQAATCEFDLSQDDYERLTHGRDLSPIISPEGGQIIINGTDGVGIRDIATGKDIYPFNENGYRSTRGLFSSDGREVVTFGSVSMDKKDVAVAQFWDRHTLQKLTSIENVSEVIYSPDGRTFVTLAIEVSKGRGSHPVSKVWDAQTYQERFSMGGEFGALRAVYSPDGASIAAYHPQKGIYIWNAESGEGVQLRTYIVRPGGIAFSSDGKRVFVAEGTLDIWDVDTKRRAKQSLDYGGVFWNVVSHPHENSVAAVDPTEESTIVVDTETWKIKYKLKGAVVGYSPDGRNIVTVDQKTKEMRIWDSASGLKIVTMPGKIESAGFSRDGRYLVTFSKKAVVWDTLVFLGGSTFPSP
jgi:hypothetical protein